MKGLGDFILSPRKRGNIIQNINISLYICNMHFA